MPTSLLEPAVLTGEHIRLEPLQQCHADDLRPAAAEPHEEVWYTVIPTPDTLGADYVMRTRLRDEGSMNPFVIRRRSDGALVGETTYCGIDATSPRVEIGHTWLAPSAQRSPINTEAKLLLLEHAFERCDVIAVQFCSHFHNRRSRAAIERLGAKLDGVLRNHRYGPDGTLRDTAVYSILPHEWPGVKHGLEARLARG